MSAIAKIAEAIAPPTVLVPLVMPVAIASAIFAIALTATGSLDATSEHVAPFSGYLTVWAVCAGASFLAALALLAAPRHAFSDVRNDAVPH